MDIGPPVALEALPGGVETFRTARARAFVAAEIGQARLVDVLDAIGPPGMFRCDPYTRTLVLRGRELVAEMLGTFDGEAWLWAWANPFLALPEASTTLSRAMRDARITPAFTESFVTLGEHGPHDMALIATGNSFGDAYYIADLEGTRAAYAITPGQLAPAWPKLYELQRALTNSLLHGLTDAAGALAHAAH